MLKCEECGKKSGEGFGFNQGVDLKIRCNSCAGIELVREEDEC